ncbi:MAG: hypothetical protein H6550_03865 [Chitinophagales bacterium]|nr:hypothetical protein [Chitinophagales bacterium]
MFYPKWNNTATESPLGWDACTYYWYLPATFIYKDLKQQKFGDSIIAKYGFTSGFCQSYLYEGGNRVITYSSGVAVLELPAFTIAHILARPLGYPADGFSKPYQVAVQLWGVLAGLVGLWYFRRLLLLYFSDKATAITLFLLVVGTNYLNYAAIDVTITHSYLFTIYVFLLLNTHYFYATPNRKYAVRIGLLMGLAILVRPSEMIAAIIPLAWGMESISFSAIKERISFLMQHYRYLLLAVACTVLVGSLQVAYWWYVAGQPFVYSYTDQGFTWKSPHFWLYTFSYRSGWLVYTPLLMFVFAGLLPFLWRGKNKVAIITFFLVNYYIISAWDIWWYGGMGGRAMVQSYVVVFFIIATLVETLLRTRWLKWPVFALMLLFVYVNVWFTYTAHAASGLYDPVCMTRAYYWAVVGRFKVPAYTVRYKDTDEYFDGTPRNMQVLYTNGFEEDTTETDIEPIAGSCSLLMDAGRTYAPKMGVSYVDKHADWVRVKAKIHMTCWEWETWRQIQLTVGFLENKNYIKRNTLRLNHATEHWDDEIFFDVKIPGQSFDSVDIVIWNPGTTCPVMVDDIELWSFEE